MLSPSETNRISRVLDANRNRAVEGVRVLEDYARFVISNSGLAQKMKDFRHAISSACMDYSDDWLMQRDADSDVGAQIKAENEYERADFSSVIIANCSRVSEALRVLEEYGKLLTPTLGGSIETLRYRFYELEKDVKSFVQASDQLAGRSLYILTSGCDSESDFIKRIEMLVSSGVHVVQLREKNLADGVLLQRAKIASDLCRQHNALFIVNDRPDIAVMAGANGVHLGQEEFSVKDVRLLVPKDMLIGISTHSLEQACQAEVDGADYIGVGPTFPSNTKCFQEFHGTELLQQVAAEIAIPAFAIGGINLENLSDVLASGFGRVAVSNAIHQDPTGEAVRLFLNRLSADAVTT